MSKNNRLKGVLVTVLLLFFSFFFSIQTQAATRISLDKTSVKSVVGMAYELTLKGVPVSSLKDGDIQWYTSNSSIVSLIDDLQLNKNTIAINLRNKGTATITAKYRGKIYKCRVTSYLPKGTVKVGRKTITLSESKDCDIFMDTSKNKTATIRVSNKAGCKVIYDDNTYVLGSSVISVSSSGKITAKKAGKASVLVLLIDRKSFGSMSVEYYYFNVVVKDSSVNTGFVLNKDYKAMELSTHIACTKEASKVRTLVNNWRKRKGLRTVSISTKLNHSAGYLMRAYGGESKNDAYNWWFGNDHGVQSDKDVANVVKAYKYSGSAYLIYVESTSYKNIFNDILKDMNGVNYLAKCKTMGMYTTARGTMILFGF